MPPAAVISSIASRAPLCIAVSAIERTPESEKRTPSLIGPSPSLPPALVAAASELEPLDPQAASSGPAAERARAVAPPFVISSRLVDCLGFIDSLLWFRWAGERRGGPDATAETLRW